MAAPSFFAQSGYISRLCSMASLIKAAQTALSGLRQARTVGEGAKLRRNCFKYHPCIVYDKFTLHAAAHCPASGPINSRIIFAPNLAPFTSDGGLSRSWRLARLGTAGKTGCLFTPTASRSTRTRSTTGWINSLKSTV